MAVFSYRAARRDGVVMEGVIEAADEEAAVVRLKSAGAIPLKVHVENKGIRERMSLGSSKADLPSFTAELYVLMNAGLPLDRGLHILAEAFENKSTHDVVLSLLKAVREGTTFSDALRMHPRIFPEFYINMIKAGESGGALDVVLDKLNEFLESSRQLKEQIFSALIYPAILLATCMISI
ncbi:MAG: type II secretion system F family protein, partial [Syntrophales bacterium]|nr:type II secretion system F family protein [Syntrophales bacterium]